MFMKEAVGKGTTAHSWQRRLVSVVLQFVILFAFWLLLCCHFRLQYYLMGAAAAGLVTYLTNDLLYASLQQGESLRRVHWRGDRRCEAARSPAIRAGEPRGSTNDRRATTGVRQQA